MKRTYMWCVLGSLVAACERPSEPVVTTPPEATAEVRPIESALPPGLPLAQVVCGDTNYTRILVYSQGRLFVDGAFNLSEGAHRPTRIFYSGELTTPSNFISSGMNVLPWVAPKENLRLGVTRGFCGTLDGSKTCTFSSEGVDVLAPVKDVSVTSIQPAVMVDGKVQAPRLTACGNIPEETSLQVTLANPFSWKPHVAASDMIVTLFGQNLASDTQNAKDATDPPLKLSDVRVKIDGGAARLLYASPTQLNVWIQGKLDSSLPLHDIEVLRGENDILAGKGTFQALKGAPGIHPTAFTRTRDAKLSLLMTGISGLRPEDLRVRLNGRMVELSSARGDVVLMPPNAAGYQTLSISLKDRLSTQEILDALSVQILPREDNAFWESNVVSIPGGN